MTNEQLYREYKNSPCILCREISEDFDLFRDPGSNKIVKICKKCQVVLGGHDK